MTIIVHEIVSCLSPAHSGQHGVSLSGRPRRTGRPPGDRALRDRLGLTAAQVDGVLADMWRQYLGVANTELIDYARSLRPAYRTGILSNSFVGAREREQRAYGLGDLVDVHIYSHEVGMLKPDPALWALACEWLGVAPGEMVSLDNSARLVDSATEFGIRAVLSETNARARAEIEALL